jgi:hypothetical protein
VNSSAWWLVIDGLMESEYGVVSLFGKLPLSKPATTYVFRGFFQSGQLEQYRHVKLVEDSEERAQKQRASQFQLWTFWYQKRYCHVLNQYGQHRFEEHEGESAWRVEDERLYRFMRGES